MGHKFGFYTVNMPLEEVYNRTLSFWATNNGTIKSQTLSPNKLITILNIQRGISMSSYGEKYTMRIGYNPSNTTTYVSVEVALAFGSGMQWLKPQNIMKKWAFELRITPMKLTRTVDPNFIKIFDDIQNIAVQPRIQEPTIFCPRCGGKNNQNNTFCQECGTKLL